MGERQSSRKCTWLYKRDCSSEDSGQMHGDIIRMLKKRLHAVAGGSGISRA